MKLRRNKMKHTYLMALGFVVILASCKKTLDINNDPNSFTDVPVNTMAIAYNNLNGESDHPVSPCGMCRQYISEYEVRTRQPIRLILSGMTGKVFIIQTASQLLPLSFGGEDLL